MRTSRPGTDLHSLDHFRLDLAKDLAVDDVYVVHLHPLHGWVREYRGYYGVTGAPDLNELARQVGLVRAMKSERHR